jgi:hypothetical protein
VFERTQVRSNAPHGRTHEQGSNACPAGPSGYLRSNTRDLRSNARPVSPSRHSSYLRSNARLAFDPQITGTVRTQVVCSNALQCSCQPINRTLCFLLFFTFGNDWRRPFGPKSSLFFTFKHSKRHFIVYFNLYFILPLI